MKKIVSSLVVCACLGVSAISASAASSTNIKEGSAVNLDSFLASSPEGTIKLSSSSTKGVFSIAKASNVQEAGGGTFWVEWGGDRHWSNYNHPTKTHRSSASNKKFTERSAWESKEDLASVWIKSTLTGNKANWATK
ncbi:lactococcin 972 family bacteriocin [Niallia sp. BSM11]|uniref:lactococcin 972 family bacteriocin n=1 Tax=Niallia sp. BSM11 TaxID=3391576 RepID=UPI0039846D18